MQVPILNGIYTDEGPDFRVAYPKNLVPTPLKQGISAGSLRPADGIVGYENVGPGIGRGGINWNERCYRVMGSKLVRQNADGSLEELGDVENGGQVTLDYSFDYLGIASNNKFFLYDGATVQQVTDPDLGPVITFLWVDGYFMTTDGENLVVTELNDPFSVNPLKFGSSEVDPDPVVALLKVRNEVHALNRYTIEVFDNIGGDNFPFQRVDGAQIQRGCIGTHACAIFLENIAFIGGARNESPAVWLGASGQSRKISTREIELILGTYSMEVLSKTLMEAKVDKGHQQLLIHLPDRTLVYDAVATQSTGEVVWSVLSSSVLGDGQYLAKDLVWCYDNWLVTHPRLSRLGFLSRDTMEHWGAEVGWEFNTLIIYNGAKGLLIHEVELIALSGRTQLGEHPVIWTSYSLEGEVFSQEKSIRAGKIGNRTKRLVWLQQGNMRKWRIQKFRGTSDTRLTIARLDMREEVLTV